MDNVLQTHAVFVNVSKGQLASQQEILKAFQTTETAPVILEILKKGELQVSTLERNSQLSTIHKDIANIIAEKTVNPETKRPYPVSMIEKVITDMGFSVSSSKSAKQQVPYRFCASSDGVEGERLTCDSLHTHTHTHSHTPPSLLP